MMEPFSSELLHGGLSDARLRSLGWSDDGSDMLLEFDKPGRDARRVTVRFAWATNCHISLDFGEYSGAPLVFEARTTKLPPDRYLVEIVFGAAPEGSIQCECNAIVFE